MRQIVCENVLCETTWVNIFPTDICIHEHGGLPLNPVHLMDAKLIIKAAVLFKSKQNDNLKGCTLYL